ncbi:MAG: hypothetical protein NTY87_00460 [Planctomycetia bacterium]|nr:hypothetical protein [Planctomycetia bacterium]
MKQLDYFRSQLVDLCRQAQQVRLATAASGMAIALLLVLAGIFALDWSFRKSEDTFQRLFVLGLGLTALGWSFFRYAKPWLKPREEPMEMALRVQRHAGIDSDLVAALQFESATKVDWGSPALTTALIDNVSSRQRQVDLKGVIRRDQLFKRMKMLGIVAAVWLLVTCLIPGYVGVFFNRLLLGAQQYPTLTQIKSIVVNGRTIDLSKRGDAVVRVAYGRPVKFDIRATGPEISGGRIELSGAKGGQSAVVSLEPVVLATASTNPATPPAKPTPTPPSPDDAPAFKGLYPRLLEDARCQIYLGDAWTEPLKLTIIPSPAVEVEPEVVPPLYARSGGQELLTFPRGTRQFSVVEGSEVRLNVSSDRPLKQVTLTAGQKAIAFDRNASASTPDLEIWSPQLANTQLAAIAEPLRYSIDVVDNEDQTLERPLEGFIRIEPDLPPRIVAATRTPFILPGAQPTSYYGVTDDHAVGRIWFTWEVLRGGSAEAAGAKAVAVTANDLLGNVPAASVAAAAAENVANQFTVELYQLEGNEAPEPVLEGAYSFDLKKIPLSRGDALKIIFHATDYRGKNPGKTAHAEPLVFQVTDEQGIMASMLEGDQKSARELQMFIKQLLGLGDTP